jgi:hypothetical protein
MTYNEIQNKIEPGFEFTCNGKKLQVIEIRNIDLLLEDMETGENLKCSINGLMNSFVIGQSKELN